MQSKIKKVNSKSKEESGMIIERRFTAAGEDPFGSFNLPSSCAEHGVLAHDRPKCHPCRGKTHDSRFPIFGSPNNLALAHEKTTLEKYILQKVPPVHEKPGFSNCG